MTGARKRCARCGRTRMVSMFHRNKSTKDGLQAYCKDCVKPYARDAERNKVYFRKYRYGITEEAYDALLQSQNGCCAICESTERLSIDHNHESGVVRGILCIMCNFAVGYFKDDPETIKRALAYVEAFA